MTMSGQSLVRQYHRMPDNLRLLVTALVGAAIGLLTYEIIYFLNPVQPKATISWALSSIVNIARQHALHRWLSFTYPTPYWPSLGRAYVMYSGSAVVTILLNLALTAGLGINHRVVWLICMLTTAGISFIFLRRFVFRSKHMPL